MSLVNINLKTITLLISTFLLAVKVTWAGDVFTSLVELPKLLHTEKYLADEIRNYIQAEEARLDKLRQLASDYDRHSREGLADPESYVGNPVSAYLLIKRFAADWSGIIQRDIRANTSEEFLHNISQRISVFPDQSDLDGAATALIRLQDTYALSTEDLVNGHLKGVERSPNMTADDCFQLGTVTYNQQDYYHTILWMEQALNILEGEPTPTVDRATVLDYLAYSVYMQGNVRRAYNLTLEWLRYDPDHIRAQNNLAYFQKFIKEQEVTSGVLTDAEVEKEINAPPKQGYKSTDYYTNYERLCRGEKTHVRPFEKDLKCYYRRHHPYLYIRPALEEVVNLRPRICIFHNIVTDSEIEMIKNLAHPRLYRSVVYHASGDSATSTQDYRISKSAWIKDEEDTSIAKVSFRASAIANLTLDTAEQLQVLNYGIGGHYEPHFDFSIGREFTGYERAARNRIATFICYLSDVTSGGATVFPDIGVKLFPRKGSCALWYNIKKSGDGDMNTRHAACPVLTGFKWVANKWFHEGGQEFVRPCSRDREEYE